MLVLSLGCIHLSLNSFRQVMVSLQYSGKSVLYQGLSLPFPQLNRAALGML